MWLGCTIVICLGDWVNPKEADQQDLVAEIAVVLGYVVMERRTLGFESPAA